VLVSLNANYIILVLAVLFGVITSFISYYGITFPGGKGRIYLLLILRACALFLAFMFLSEPILTLISKSQKPPVLAILLDNSKSMQIVDRTGDRKKIAKRIAEKLNEIQINGEKKFFTFSTDVREKKNFTPDSLDFSGGATDITSALKKINSVALKENIKGIVLVSDGAYNIGENPSYFAERVEIPIFTIGIGDSSAQKDIKITDVLFNDVVFAGSENPLVVRVSASGFEPGQEISVKLYDESKEIGSEKVKLASGTNEYTVNFKFVPRDEGVRKFIVKVQQLPGEVTHQNNQKSFYVKVLKGKYKVLIVSGAPSPDLAFIKRALVENKNYEVISYTEKKGKEFIEGNFDIKNAESADVFVFVGYPVKTSDEEILMRLKNLISAQNKPFLFILSRTVDFNKLRGFDVLPFKFSMIKVDPALTSEDVVSLAITEEGRNHSATDIGDGNYIWNILPPVFKVRGSFTPAPGSSVLAKAKYQNVETNEPLIVANRVGTRKSIALLCYGIWRWKLLTATNKEFEGFFEKFVNNTVNWLIAPSEEEFIRFKVDKNFFMEDEEVKFTAQVYNENYRPIEDAEIKVEISSLTTDKVSEELPAGELNLEHVGSGIYSGGISLTKGDYKYTASISKARKTLKVFSGRFTVGESEIEFSVTNMNVKLLREIAQKTKGVFLLPDEVDSLDKIINSAEEFKATVVEDRKEYILWSRYETLFAVIFLLSVEWFLRKRFGLA